MKSVLIAVALLIIIAIGILVGPLLLEGTRQWRAADSTFDDFALALSDRNYAVAYSMGTPEFQREISLANFEKQQAQLQREYGALKLIKRTSTSLHGRGKPMQWISRIEADQEYEHANATFIYELHFVEDKWRIFGYKQLLQ